MIANRIPTSDKEVPVAALSRGISTTLVIISWPFSFFLSSSIILVLTGPLIDVTTRVQKHEMFD